MSIFIRAPRYECVERDGKFLPFVGFVDFWGYKRRPRRPGFDYNTREAPEGFQRGVVGSHSHPRRTSPGAGEASRLCFGAEHGENVRGTSKTGAFLCRAVWHPSRLLLRLRAMSPRAAAVCGASACRIRCECVTRPVWTLLLPLPHPTPTCDVRPSLGRGCVCPWRIVLLCKHRGREGVSERAQSGGRSPAKGNGRPYPPSPRPSAPLLLRPRFPLPVFRSAPKRLR